MAEVILNNDNFKAEVLDAKEHPEYRDENGYRRNK